MSSPTNPEGPPRSPAEFRALEERVEALERRLAELHRPSPVPADVGLRDPSLSLRIAQLARKFREHERGASELASRVEAHEETLKLLCLAIKELDDPYGMGSDLDERLGLGEALSDPDDAGELP